MGSSVVKGSGPDAAANIRKALIMVAALEVSGLFQFLCGRSNVSLADFVEFDPGTDANMLVSQPGQIDGDRTVVRRMEVFVELAIESTRGRGQATLQAEIDAFQITAVEALE